MAIVERIEAEHVGGHAEERLWKPVEGERILVAHGNGTERVADVESIQEAVRQAESDLGHHFLAHVTRTGVALLVVPVVADLPLDAGLHVLVVIVERDGEGETLLVAADLVGLETVRNLVGHHHRPVDGAHQGVQVVCIIAQRIQAGNESTHAGAAHHVDGDAHLFDIAEDAQVCHSQGAATPQHHRHGGTVLPDGVHLGTYADDGQGVFSGCDAGCAEMVLGHTGDGEEQGKEGKKTFHGAFRIHSGRKIRIFSQACVSLHYEIVDSSVPGPDDRLYDGPVSDSWHLYRRGRNARLAD